VHTCTKQWSLCGIFGKNGLKSMWCYNLIKHLFISRTEKYIKEMLPKWIYGTFFPPCFGPFNLCVHLPCWIMPWNIVEKSQIKMKNKFQKNSPCAKHNLEFVFNLYYKNLYTITQWLVIIHVLVNLKKKKIGSICLMNLMFKKIYELIEAFQKKNNCQ
jgi:hypothetical protein